MEFIPLFGGTICIVGIAFIALAALTIVLATSMGGSFGKLSGWKLLAKTYPGPAQPPPNVHTTSIQLGIVYYRFGIRIAPTPQGLYLGFNSVYRYPPLLIPWAMLKNPRSTILFWLPAIHLDVGNPPITEVTLKQTDYSLIEPYLLSIGVSLASAGTSPASTTGLPAQPPDQHKNPSSGEIHCPSCSKSIRSGSKYCDGCGKPVG